MKERALTFVSRKRRFANRKEYFANSLFPPVLLIKADALYGQSRKEKHKNLMTPVENDENYYAAA